MKGITPLISEPPALGMFNSEGSSTAAACTDLVVDGLVDLLSNLNTVSDATSDASP